MNYGSGLVPTHPQVPQNSLYNFYNPTPDLITSADSARVGKKIVDDAFSNAAAFAMHQWIHIELPQSGPVPPPYPLAINPMEGLSPANAAAIGRKYFHDAIALVPHPNFHIEFPPEAPIPPPYPVAIDPMAGLSPANAAAIGRKYFHDTIASVKNFVMPPPDPNQVDEPLEINRDEGLSARNTGIVGRRVVEDILSCIIESGLNSVALIYSVGRTVINVARMVFGLPPLAEPAAKGANPEEDANDLNALNALDELDDIEEEPEVEEEDPEFEVEDGMGDVDPEDGIDDAHLDPVDGFVDDVDGVEDDFGGDAPLDDEYEDDPDLGVPVPGGYVDPFGAPAAAAVINPAHRIAGTAGGTPQGQPRRVLQQTQRMVARPPQPVAPPPPRIEDTDPFYTLIPQLTQPQADDLAFLLTALNGSAGSITMNALKLRQRGANVDPVHPFRFLSHVMTNPELRTKFKTLRERNDLFGTQFVAEFDAKFSGYQDRGQLIPYHKGFAHAMRVNPKTVETLCNEKKWKLLILLLNETASGAKAPFVPKVPVVKPVPQRAQIFRTPQAANKGVTRYPATNPAFTGGPSGSRTPVPFFVDPTGQPSSSGNPFSAYSGGAPFHFSSPIDAQVDLDGNPIDNDDFLDDIGDDGTRTPTGGDPLDGIEGDEEVHSDGEVSQVDSAEGDPEVEDEEVEEEEDLDDLAALTAAKPLTAEQQATVARIFEQVATSDPFTLGVKILNIKSDWKQLHDTHPAMLLKEVFGSVPILQNLRTIHRDFTKRDLFINDLSDACAKGEQKNSETTLEKTQETLTELGITKVLTAPIQWRELIKELIADKCIIATSDELTPVQTQTIDQALTSIANTNEFMLLGHLISLRKKWSSLEQTCPLQTLRYIFTQKQDLIRQITSQPFKKGPFLADVATTLKNSCKMRDISAHTAGFAAEFGIAEDLLANKEWSRVLAEMITTQIPPIVQAAVHTPPPVLNPATPRQSSDLSEPSTSAPVVITATPAPINAAPVVITPVPATSDPLSAPQKGTIDEIFADIATKNELWLLGNIIPLERKWASLEQACPLQILRYVFTDKKAVFHQINDKTVRRGPFLIDLSKTLKNSGKDRDLSSFAAAFAAEFGVTEDVVTRKDWSSIIDTIKRKQIDEADRASRASSSSTNSASSSSKPLEKMGAAFKSFGGFFGGKKDGKTDGKK